MQPRRSFLSRLVGLPFVALDAASGLQGPAPVSTHKPLKIMMKSAWGSDDPTKAAFPFSHGLALSEAGHEVQIFLLGEAVVLMRKAVAEAVTPVGWPILSEFLEKVAARHIPLYACGACSRARGVTEADLTTYGAKYGNPTIFVSMVEWADRVITE
jgi:sulfur relay (sulfurtransferase) complex TusBCD TusD component (DsrE family)